jgi:hypothetical protein
VSRNWGALQIPPFGEVTWYAFTGVEKGDLNGVK